MQEENFVPNSPMMKRIFETPDLNKEADFVAWFMGEEKSPTVIEQHKKSA